MKKAKAVVLLVLLGLMSMPIIASTVPEAVSSPDPGTVVVLTPHYHEICEIVEAAFEAENPSINVEFMILGAHLCLTHLRETRASPDTDVVWGGGLDALELMKDEDLIAQHMLPEDINASIMDSLFGLPLKDPERYFYSHTLDGFGIMYHHEYLAQYDLPEPTDWTDLVDPVYFGHVCMSTPSRSSSTHMIVEIILQAFGWEEGWKLLYKIGANVGEFTEKSTYVPAAVSVGEYGIGLVIDFYALAAAAEGYPVEFTYPPNHTVIEPDCVGLVKNGPNPEDGEKFINYLLSYEGQKLLFNPAIGRMPIREDVYAEAPEGYRNPFLTEMTVIEYNSTIGTLRKELLGPLFDCAITYRHAELIAAWSAIMTSKAAADSAEAEGYDVSDARAMIDEALNIMCLPPLNETEMIDLCEEYAAASSENRAKLVAKLKARWDGYAVVTFASAKMKAEDARSLLWTYTIRDLRDSINIIMYAAIICAVIMPLIWLGIYHFLVVKRIA